MRSIVSIFLITISILGCASNTTTELNKVYRVIDGDTFDVVLESGATERVRLLGVDTPETFSSNKTGEYNGITEIACLDSWGDKATVFATEILTGNSVRLILDTLADERDYYDRLLSYVEIDGEDFGVMLLENGYARVYIEGKSGRKGEYLLVEEQAKSKKLGLWSCGMSFDNRGTNNNNLKYDPFGPDKDCGDFSIWKEAQDFFEAAGGPVNDPHRLDGNNDGIVCESLR